MNKTTSRRRNVKENPPTRLVPSRYAPPATLLRRFNHCTTSSAVNPHKPRGEPHRAQDSTVIVTLGLNNHQGMVPRATFSPLGRTLPGPSGVSGADMMTTPGGLKEVSGERVASLDLGLRSTVWSNPPDEGFMWFWIQQAEEI
ncbi:hypothetical protein AKJ16_DCAP23619 [Drosera capensis]